MNRPTGRRLRLLAVYWLAQAALIHFATAVWFAVIPADGAMYGFSLDADHLFTPWYLIWVVTPITTAQALYLLPLRRPGLVERGGRSVRTSLAVAGLMIAAMILAAVAAVLSLFDEELQATWKLAESSPLGGPGFMIAVALIAWACPTVLLLALVRRGRRESVLGRLATVIFAGTAAEAALLLPIDVMVRRRMNCYCAEGSFVGLTLLGWVGILAAGPVAIIPAIARARRGWYRTHCPRCGYDMSATLGQDRCPECGCAWKDIAGRAAGVQIDSPDDAR